MHLFYTPLLEAHHQQFPLDEAESKHAVRVLRLQKGQTIGLRNGKGLVAEAEIADDNPKRVILQIQGQPVLYPAESRFHLLIAPTKNMDRLEWLLEKCTEIGIASLTPFICARSERKEVNIERLQKVAVAAMKQAQRAYLPEIHPGIKFTQGIARVASLPGEKWIAHCTDLPKRFWSPSAPVFQDQYILVGPEGDFTPEEVKLAFQNGFEGLDLGTWRLRTETAGLMACTEVARHARNLSV
jgi:16S rRNA (uracil1498-N3)-methyltransferase